MPSVSRGALWTVYLVMLMDTLNFGIVFPLLPAIAKSFGASATLVGSMATTYSFFQMIATPFLGQISDKYGRRPVLLLSLLGTTLSSVGTGLALNFPMLIAARCINGISGGTVGVVNAYVADVTSKEEKSTYMSYISAANSIGIILGPAFGGILAQWGFPVACYVSAGLSALNLLVAIPLLVESRWSQARDVTVPLAGGGDAAGAGAHANGAAAVPRRHTVPCPAYYLYFASFLLIFGFAAMESIQAYYLMDTFFNGDDKAAAQFYGYQFMFVGVAVFIMAAFVYRPLKKLCGEMPLVVVGMCIRTGGFLFQAVAPTKWWFVAATMAIVCGNQLTFPTTASLLTTMCHHSIYGKALGYLQAGQALSRVIGPQVFGAAYDHISHEFSFYACAAMTVLAGVSIVMAWHFQPREAEAPPAGDVVANVDQMVATRSLSSPFEEGEDSVACRRLARSNSIDSAGLDYSDSGTPSVRRLASGNGAITPICEA